MRRKLLITMGAVVTMSGCYHITVTTGAQPSTTSIDEPWQMSFVNGLVPPEEIQADEEGCSNGVARVETKRSFLNLFVSVLSSGIVSPITVTVTCASGTPPPEGPIPADGERAEEGPGNDDSTTR